MQQPRLLLLLIGVATFSATFILCSFVYIGPGVSKSIHTEASLISVQNDDVTTSHRKYLTPIVSEAAVVESSVGDINEQVINDELDKLSEQSVTSDTNNEVEISKQNTTSNQTQLVTQSSIVDKNVQTLVPKTSKSKPSGPTDFEKAVAATIHKLTNQEREKNGLPALGYDSYLASDGFTYSVRMQTENFFAHEDPLGCDMTCRFRKSGYKAQSWGENLAYWKSSYSPSVDELASYFVREWKKSEGHRDNLLSETFTYEGIGVSVKNNKVYVTVHFAKPI